MKLISENSTAVVANQDGAADSNGVYSGMYVGNFHVGFDSLRQARNTAAPRVLSPENTTLIQGGIWRNWVNFRVNLATDNVARITRITEVDLQMQSPDMRGIPGFPEKPFNLMMNYNIPGTMPAQAFTKDSVFIERWSIGGGAAPNFKVYYLEQRPDFIVPLSSELIPRIVGAAEANLTNEQHLVKYGTSIGGGLAPCGRGGVSCDTLRVPAEQWGIYGLVERQGR